MRIIIDGKPYADRSSTKVVEAFLQQQIRTLKQNEDNLATRTQMKIQNPKNYKSTNCTKNITSTC